MSTRLSLVRYVPTGAVKVTSKRSDSVVYLYARGDRLGAVGYAGKAQRPTFHFTFRTAQRRVDYVSAWLQGQDASAQRRQEQAAARRAALAGAHALAVGTVLTGSWGYDQTNVEFYEVTRLIGRRTVELRQLATESIDTASMQGTCVPLPGSYRGDAITRRVDERNGVKLHDSCWLHAADRVTVAGVAVGYRAAHWTAYA